MGKFYGQIIWEPDNAVTQEQEFETEAEAKAYVKGFEDLKADLDLGDESYCDDYSARVSTEPAPDEEDFEDDEDGE